MSTYCTKDDVRQVGGTENVDSNWGKLDATDTQVDVDARIDLAIEYASEQIDLYARSATGYAIPLVDPDTENTPIFVKWLAAELATVWLLEATGPKIVGEAQNQPGHILWARKLRCQEILEGIRTNALKLHARLG